MCPLFEDDEGAMIGAGFTGVGKPKTNSTEVEYNRDNEDDSYEDLVRTDFP